MTELPGAPVVGNTLAWYARVRGEAMTEPKVDPTVPTDPNVPDEPVPEPQPPELKPEDDPKTGHEPTEEE